MNFLAHLFLSGNRSGIQIGNFIGDHVKGRNFEQYSGDIRKGILLHRQIDWFTDHHPIPKIGADRLREHYGRYSGVVIDVIYDHFLAVNWWRYSPIPLPRFAGGVHALLMRNYFILPREVRGFVPFLIFNKRLESYGRLDGLAKVLSIMAEYTSIPNMVDDAMRVLSANYDDYNLEFVAYWDELQAMVDRYIAELDNAPVV